MTDFLSQIAPYYDFMLLLEEGLSYGIFTEANGSKPIIVHPDGTLCINYLDTNGGPLSNLHIDMAAALVCKLAGTTPDPERSQLRKAQVRALHPTALRRLLSRSGPLIIETSCQL